jgi:hypothetical protein
MLVGIKKIKFIYKFIFEMPFIFATSCIFARIRAFDSLEIRGISTSLNDGDIYTVKAKL